VPFFVRRASSPRKGAVDSRTQRGAAGSRRRTPYSAASPTALSRVRSHGRFSTRPYLRFCAVSRRLWCTRNGVNPRCEHISDSRLVSAQSQLPKAARTRARLPTSDSGQLYHPYGRSVPSNSAWRGRGSAGRACLSQATIASPLTAFCSADRHNAAVHKVADEIRKAHHEREWHLLVHAGTNFLGAALLTPHHLLDTD